MSDLDCTLQGDLDDLIDLSVSDDDPLLNRTFSDEELKQLCTVKCTVQLKRRNIFLSYERKAVEFFKKKGVEVRNKHYRYILKKFTQNFPKHYAKFLSWESKLKADSKLDLYAKKFCACVYLNRLNDLVTPCDIVDMNCSRELLAGDEVKTEVDEDQSQEPTQSDQTPSTSPYASQVSAGLENFNYTLSQDNCTPSSDFANFLHPGRTSQLQIDTESQETYSQFNRQINTALEIDTVTSTQAPYYDS